MKHPDMLDTDDMKDMMELKRGDVFRNSEFDEILKVKGFQTNGDVMVTDPTVSHPQDGRSGTWPVPMLELFEDWSRNNIYPVSLSAEPDGAGSTADEQSESEEAVDGE